MIVTISNTNNVMKGRLLWMSKMPALPYLTGDPQKATEWKIRLQPVIILLLVKKCNMLAHASGLLI